MTKRKQFKYNEKIIQNAVKNAYEDEKLIKIVKRLEKK